jgi:hypothetical protein
VFAYFVFKYLVLNLIFSGGVKIQKGFPPFSLLRKNNKTRILFVGGKELVGRKKFAGGKNLPAEKNSTAEQNLLTEK